MTTITPLENALEVEVLYHCAQCGESFSWCYHDIMQVTNVPHLQCGCLWQFLVMDGSKGS